MISTFQGPSRAPSRLATPPTAPTRRMADAAASATAVALLALMAVPGAAQQPADTVALQELVVTATRMPLPKDAVPAPVTVLRGEDLRARGIRRVADALVEVPGLSVVRSGAHGAQTSLFLRGGESDYVQVLLDGVPLNQPGGSLDLAGLTTDNVERIEVVRGPASVLYGSDAVTGVVQIFTREGRGRPTATARVEGGSFEQLPDGRASLLDWNVGLHGGGEGVSYAFGYGRFRSDGLFALNNASDNDVASGMVRVRPAPRTTAAFSFRRTDQRFHFPTDFTGQPVDANAVSFTETTTLALDVSRHLSDRLEARLLLGSNAIDGGTDDLPDTEEETDAFRSTAAVDRLTADLQASLRLGATILTAGAVVEEESERRLSISSFGNDAGDRERDSRGVYGQVFTRPLDGLSLTGGVRLEDNQVFGGHATWRVGATGAALPWLRLRGAAGTAFKEPTFLESFGSAYVVGNPDLEPEESLSLEAGADLSVLAGRVEVAATAFTQEFENLIDFTFAPPTEGGPNYFNVVGARARGVEVSATLRPHPRLELVPAWTWLDTEVTDPGFDTAPDAQFAPGVALLRRPGGSGTALLRWTPRGHGSWALLVRHTGEREDLDFSGFPAERVVLPAFTTVDVSAAYPLMGGAARRPSLAATLRVENVLDERYQNPVGFPAPGRLVVVGVRAGVGL